MRWASQRFAEWVIGADPSFMSRWIKQYGFALADVRVTRAQGSFSWVSLDRILLIALRDEYQGVISPAVSGAFYAKVYVTDHGGLDWSKTWFRSRPCWSDFGPFSALGRPLVAMAGCA